MESPSDALLSATVVKEQGTQLLKPEYNEPFSPTESEKQMDSATMRRSTEKYERTPYRNADLYGNSPVSTVMEVVSMTTGMKTEPK